MHGKERTQIFGLNTNHSIKLVNKHVPENFKFHRRKQKGHSKNIFTQTVGQGRWENKQ